eukprot:1652040-Pleurochrysis_carterae.AAC.1
MLRRRSPLPPRRRRLRLTRAQCQPLRARHRARMSMLLLPFRPRPRRVCAFTSPRLRGYARPSPGDLVFVPRKLWP